jgi:hypothetical protein
MENTEKIQTQVKNLNIGDTVITLNGDKWKIISMQPCNRAGALTKDGEFLQIQMQNGKKKMKNVWHHEVKVLVPQK